VTTFTIKPQGTTYNAATGKREPTFRGEIDEGALTVTSADKPGRSGALEGEGTAAVLFFFVLIGIVLIALYFIGKGTVALVKKLIAYEGQRRAAKLAAAEAPTVSLPPAPALRRQFIVLGDEDPRVEARLRAQAEAEYDEKIERASRRS
jgi:hypothetical protein